MRKTPVTCQYGVQPEGRMDRGTRLMTFALIGMTIAAGGLFGYDELIRNTLSTPLAVETNTRHVPLSNMQDKDPVIDYIIAWAGSRNRTEARKYARTVAVLDQCGLTYRSVRKTYEAENQQNFDILKTRIVPGSATPQTRTQVASNEINADMFKLDIATTSGNSMLAAGAMAQELENPYPEEAFERRPTNDECRQVKEMSKAGKLAVRT